MEKEWAKRAIERGDSVLLEAMMRDSYTAYYWVVCYVSKQYPEIVEECPDMLVHYLFNRTEQSVKVFAEIAVLDEADKEIIESIS